jgi:hypothetical protein
VREQQDFDRREAEVRHRRDLRHRPCPHLAHPCARCGPGADRDAAQTAQRGMSACPGHGDDLAGLLNEVLHGRCQVVHPLPRLQNRGRAVSATADGTPRRVAPPTAAAG